MTLLPPSAMIEALADRPVLAAAAIAVLLILLYLVRLNQLLLGTPPEIEQLAQPPWTADLLVETYKRLEASPITTASYAKHIPPKLERRYIVTGGSGLVGGYIVLQLLERGQPPSSIRIVDFRRPNRADMLHGPATSVDFVQTDISSASATEAAFSKPWPSSVAHLPLTVFHTAAVIVPSDRSPLLSAFCDAVNIGGTRNVLASARRAGADVLVSTTSASISIRPVGLWVAPWRMLFGASAWPRNFAQVLDAADFAAPLRPHGDFYANYPASKAAAERLVCAANSPRLRTGCVRPANGVYGNPTDNTLGGALAKAVLPTWTSHITQSFAHGLNVALAHLALEAVLHPPPSSSSSSTLPPQAGRPFVITDPNPPIRYRDLYFLVQTLSATPFRALPLPPALMVLASYPVEWYTLARARWAALGRVLPPLRGEVKHLQPGIFSICTHLVASNSAAEKRVEDGGLGFRGVVTTLEGMVQEAVEWNREHEGGGGSSGLKGGVERKAYLNSVSLADEIAKAAAAVQAVASGE